VGLCEWLPCINLTADTSTGKFLQQMRNHRTGGQKSDHIGAEVSGGEGGTCLCGRFWGAKQMQADAEGDFVLIKAATKLELLVAGGGARPVQVDWSP
jgi:hypothetical protein